MSFHKIKVTGNTEYYVIEILFDLFRSTNLANFLSTDIDAASFSSDLIPSETFLDAQLHLSNLQMVLK